MEENFIESQFKDAFKKYFNCRCLITFPMLGVCEKVLTFG